MSDPGKKPSGVRTRRRRGLVAALTVAIAGALAISSLPAGADDARTMPAGLRCGVGANLEPACGLLWGVYTDVAEGRNPYTTITDLEADTGRKFDVIRRYNDFSGKGIPGIFPDQYEQQLGADGSRILFMGWTTRLHGTTTRIPWRDITAGKYDESIIKPAAQRIKDFGKPVFVDFDHEAEGQRNPNQGSGADYIAAWRHIYNIFKAESVTNVTWVWVHVGWIGHASIIKQFYPGDQYVDWIGYDPFNYYYCKSNPWRSPGVAIGTWYNWLQQNGFDDKPIMLAEYGTAADPANEWAQAEWYRNLPDALAKYPKIKGLVQFNTFKRCDTRISTRLDVLEAYGDAGRSPFVWMHRN